MSDSKIRLLLVDDHTAVRQAIRGALEEDPHITVAGEAANARDALRMAVDLAPDVVLLDVRLPDQSGIALLRDLVVSAPNSRVVMFTMYTKAAYVTRAIESGALGFVSKSAELETLVEAIRSAHRGRAFFEPAISRAVLGEMATEIASRPGATGLTNREAEVLTLVADGKSNKEVASFLSISEETVKTHLKKVRAKLGAADRAEAVAIALRGRLID